eukprot:Macronucleus_5000.p1 GENE.Macronucleus_5000~~Macronucleus_5000.p1  ORF type:complete len:180 (+),score=71.03 Macronucleus_5000:1-540(+)
MVTEFGLSPKLGTLNLSTESGYQKGYSQQTNRMIDQEIHRIVSERYASCKAILLENKEKIEQLAEELLDKETLSLPDIVDILGPRPYPIKESVIEYMQELRARKDQEEEIASQEKQIQDDERKDAIESTKFDPDAEEKAEDEAGDEVDAAEPAKPNEKAADAEQGKDEAGKDADKDKKE